MIPLPLDRDSIMTQLDALLVILLALQLGDYISTLKAIKAGGTEANPVVRKLMGKFGLETGLGIAKVVGALVAFYLYYLEQPIVLGGLIALYFLVVANNFRISRHAQSNTNG